MPARTALAPPTSTGYPPVSAMTLNSPSGTGRAECQLLGVLPHVLGTGEQVVDASELETGFGEVARLQVARVCVLVRAEHECC